jgi:formamidopyrimidine-DNA glycosylase
VPELPEVETVVRMIRPGLEGRRVEGVQASWPRTIGGLAPEVLGGRLRGATIARVWRRAKFVICELERDGRPAGALRGHLRMSGRMHVAPRGADFGPHVRARVELDDGNELVFVGVRKFGRLEHVLAPAATSARLGPEPPAEAFSPAAFARALRARRRMLKPLLLDQSFLAGLGNIYVDEALHRSRLHPERRADRVPAPAARRLLSEIRATLLEAIEREGSSFDVFYRTPEGQPGSYQHQFRVYGRHGKPCRACGSTVVRLVIGQRGTHVCPRCQRRPASLEFRAS